MTNHRRNLTLRIYEDIPNLNSLFFFISSILEIDSFILPSTSSQKLAKYLDCRSIIETNFLEQEPLGIVYDIW